MDALKNYELKYHHLNNSKNFMRFDIKTGMNDHSIGEKFMEVLKQGNIRTVFQPIVSLKDGSILGYEALSRGPEHSVLESPETLFDIARVYSKLWELEFLCRIKALENASKEKNNFTIFLNVDPDIINDEKFKKGFTKEFLRQFNINPENIVFEITEKNSIVDLNSFKKLLANYKEQGYKIAIDDTGSGYSGLKLITDIHPQFIKLDMNLIRDIDKDGLKHALIKTFHDFCLVTDIKLIAEGIETENELNTLIEIGINYGQGYFIKRPDSEISNIRPELVEHIKNRNIKKAHHYYSRPSILPIGDICRSCITVNPKTTGSEVLDIFGNNTSVFGIPVVSNKKLVGLVMKDKFYAKLATQYGFALFLNRPINLLMDHRPLSVEYDTTIDIVSKIAMTRNEENLYDYVIVTKLGDFFGIITIKDLLEKTIELEVNYAKHLNPLSGLPGNILIEEKLREYLIKSKEYTILYIDIDNFKVYNDLYGFENGDRLIEFTSRIILNCVRDLSDHYFVGHIGGDDFVIGLEYYDVQSICEQILQSFEKGIPDFYTEEHLKQKTILAKNRKGEFEQFGLLTLSIAGVSNQSRYFHDIYELTEYASFIKKKCKEKWCSCYFIE